jgi:hypothetical protein
MEACVWKWLAAGVLALAAAIAVVATVVRSPGDARQPARDAAVEDFRATERACIAAFNEALRRQRANEIDERELAAIVERDVLVPWRTMRTRVTAEPRTGELHATLRRYLESRQIAWEAYAAALRADSDQAARPHYDVYHQKNAEAQADARALGRLFRDL